MGRYVDADALIQLGLQDGAYEYVSVQEGERMSSFEIFVVILLAINTAIHFWRAL